MELKELNELCGQCCACPLHKTRKNTVFGSGSACADIMFIGEAPGESEDETGVPFVGKAGQLFDKYLDYLGISRDNVYIANILKCRPPRNRDPEISEQDACISFLREQVRIIDPKLIVCLGRISAMRLIRQDYKITAEHGTFVKKGKYVMTAVYHPSALLRDPSKKDDMLKDMEKIKEYAEKYGLKT